jgi:hypothetical protein
MIENANDRMQEHVNQGRREVEDARTAREKVDAVKRTLAGRHGRGQGRREAVT